MRWSNDQCAITNKIAWRTDHVQIRTWVAGDAAVVLLILRVPEEDNAYDLVPYSS